MTFYDFNSVNILQALRTLCGRLYLHGESQQLERILGDFSERWYNCNPHNGFKSVDVVNLICYSLVILNGDMHKPEVENKMTRNQYVRNTLLPLGDVAIDRMPDAFTSSDSPESSPTRQVFRRRSQSPQKSPLNADFRHKRSFDCPRPSQRLATRPSEPIVTRTDSTSRNDGGILMANPFFGKRSTWEKHIEAMLRKFYSSLREQPLPILPSESKRPSQDMPLPSHNSSQNLPLPRAGILKRSPSMISRAVSENPPAARNRLSTHAWQAKGLSRPRPPPINTRGTSARSSFDAQSSPPSPSSVWSKVSNFGKTQTTMSSYSLASSAPRPDYQQAIGFANALSHAIIKEEAIDDTEENQSPRRSQCLEDESLELEGAPWAKEGIVKHKHVLEESGRKARSRQWTECFAVIERGHLRLFSFTKNATNRWKRRSWEITEPGAVVGGGNWMDNAELLHTFELRHVVATPLPMNQYSRNRPHVWALSLPTGALHLFSVGTPEISHEFADTSNYWSARLSKKPFKAGFTNANYGLDPALLDTPTISEWKPPVPSMGSSQLLEVDQLNALRDYGKDLDVETAIHNKNKTQIKRYWQPQDARGVQALTNWDLRSRYLAAEKAKVSTFVAALEAASSRKIRVYESRRK